MTTKLMINKPVQTKTKYVKYIYISYSIIINVTFLFTIMNQVSSMLDRNQTREQAGSRKGFSTTDHLHIVSQLIEKCKGYKIPLVVGDLT